VFKKRYPSVIDAQVKPVANKRGTTTNYGWVNFKDKCEMLQALVSGLIIDWA